MLDGLFQQGVFLADDLIKLRRVHSGLLQLLKRLSGFNALVLVRIADEDHAVSVIQPHKELVHLFGARETRFIDEVQTAASVFGLLSAGQVMLQGMRGDARFFELLRCAGSWGEAFGTVALLFGGCADGRERSGLARAGDTLQADHLIPARENLFHHHALAAAKMRQAFLYALDLRLGSDWSIAVSSRLHPRDVVSL